ncbi:MAG: hypothetical protein IPN14_08650 [Bacteroidetes bacterium]|nr:hypothetical protein [Bacteroidota bacterium]
MQLLLLDWDLLWEVVKLKIADQLTKEFTDVKQIAMGAHVREVGAELILDCLDALGYVQKKNNKDAFTKRGYKNLSEHSEQNFRHFILFCDYSYKGYIDLDETIRLGKRP